ncbi:hypothetical protein DPMN_192627 [Dreissena polymorpha]|uniref:Uncharacterized protein n=1 Tax=Dreissena polymorpha TaxID=45954 RepID=A0A9D3Y7L0_DREPO|nr:hypothetical protein DPMN_192627 [Dreissena polymorpha]
MNLLGYGEEIRRRRVEMYREHAMLVNEGSGIITFTIVGSKGEGLSYYLESDFLIELKSVIGVESGVDLHTIPDNIKVYRMDTCLYPGHCMMLLERPASTRIPQIVNALCDDGKGKPLLGSSLFLDEFSKVQFLEGDRAERAGPSQPISTISGDHDLVWAIPCQCPGILQRWAQRPRHWPPPESCIIGILSYPRRM